MDNLIKALYNRLYRKGLNISKDEIRAKVLEINADGNITELEKNQVVEYFINSVNTLATPATTTDSKAALPDYQPSGIEKVNNSLSINDAKSIVYEQVENLELDLKASEIKSIAQEMINSNIDMSHAKSTAINLIKKYVEHQENQYINSLQNDVNHLVVEINQSMQRRSQATAQAFTHLRQGLEESTNHFKSNCDEFVSDIQSYFQN